MDQMSKIFSFFLLFWLDSGISFFFLSRAIFHRVLILDCIKTRAREHIQSKTSEEFESESIFSHKFYIARVAIRFFVLEEARAVKIHKDE